MGRPCVAGAGSITVDYAAAKLSVGSVTVTEGQILTIDGSTGEVMVGEVPTELWPKPVNVFLWFSLTYFDIFWMFFELESGVSVSGAALFHGSGSGSVLCSAFDSLNTQVPPQLSGSFGTIMQWADEVRDMKAVT